MLRAVLARKALLRSAVEMIGSPLVTGRELQQLPPCAGEAALPGQFAEPVRNFSIMRTVKRRGAIPWRIHEESLPNVL